MAWIGTCSATSTRNGKAMTNVNSANLSGKQHCSYCAHYAEDNSAGHCQKLRQTLDLQWLASCQPRSGRCFAFTHSRILPRTRVAPVIRLRWVNHKRTALYHVLTRAKRPFAWVVIANGVLPRSEVRRGRKSVICRLPRGALKCTKECNPSNAA